MSIQVADDKKVIVKVPLGTPTFVADSERTFRIVFVIICFS